MYATIDSMAKALGFDQKPKQDTHIIGTVQSVNSDGSYQVALNKSNVTTKCMPFCDATAGSRVLVLVMSNGSCAAIAKAR